MSQPKNYEHERFKKNVAALKKKRKVFDDTSIAGILNMHKSTLSRLLHGDPMPDDKTYLKHNDVIETLIAADMAVNEDAPDEAGKKKKNKPAEEEYDLKADLRKLHKKLDSIIELLEKQIPPSNPPSSQ